MIICARFYQPGSQKSKHWLYRSSGKDVSKLKTSEEVFSAQWCGKNRIVWIGERGVWTSALRPWKPRLINGTATANFVESRYRTSTPGVPQIELQEKTLTIDPSKGVLIPYVSPKGDPVLIPDESEIQVDDLATGTLKLQVNQPVDHTTNGARMTF